MSEVNLRETQGAYEKFSTPLCNLMRIAHVGELSYGANSGKHQCFQLCLRDLRDMYFSTLPFAPRKKPKVMPAILLIWVVVLIHFDVAGPIVFADVARLRVSLECDRTICIYPLQCAA